MAYDKNTWKSGDVVTSAKLNNIENGIANNNGKIDLTMDVEEQKVFLSVSFSDVMTMLNNGVIPFFIVDTDGLHTIMMASEMEHVDGEGYSVQFLDGVGQTNVPFNAATDSEPLWSSMG